MIFDIATLLGRYGDALTAGAAVTLSLAAIVWLGGLIFGVLLGVARASVQSASRSSAAALVALAAASVPILVYLLWAYYPLQQLTGWQISPFVTAAAVFTAYSILVVSELVNGGVRELPVA